MYLKSSRAKAPVKAAPAVNAEITLALQLVSGERLVQRFAPDCKSILKFQNLLPDLSLKEAKVSRCSESTPRSA